MPLSSLQPENLWKFFTELNAVPRASKQEEKVIAFIQEFGRSLGLPTMTDAMGNVIIRKPATKGMEKKQTVVLQSHLDMVHQKNAGTEFDFATEGIRMKIAGDWVVADGTTLGADNGIGVAAIMAILASKEIAHPALEALFTIDEETGMTGAKGLQGGVLEGRILLNLDTEEDNELTIGCAGGLDITATATYATVAPPVDHLFLEIKISRLTGGHSGTDIHLGRANANKLMNRILMQLDKQYHISIASVEGGGLRNAIPRESVAVIGVSADNLEKVTTSLYKILNWYKNEYETTDPSLEVLWTPIDKPSDVMERGFQSAILRSIYACPNGIYRLSPDMKDLVQTSNNLARVVLRGGEADIRCLCRSSMETEKTDMAEAITAAFELSGCMVNLSGGYPGWKPAPHSTIVTLMTSIYEELYQEKPHVLACHAGLECGILGTNYPNMDMISFGPTIRGAHSPDERVQISSVKKFWQYLLETLKRIPEESLL